MAQEGINWDNDFDRLTPSQFFRKNKQMLGFTGKIRSLTIVFHELITNSFDAAEESGILPDIDIELKRVDKEHYILRHKDNGPGIPEDAREKVFEMFYTGASHAADSRRSLGLGLSLCRSIIHAHGGSISVRDNHPSGAIFEFTLPSEEVSIHE